MINENEYNQWILIFNYQCIIIMIYEMILTDFNVAAVIDCKHGDIMKLKPTGVIKDAGNGVGMRLSNFYAHIILYLAVVQYFPCL